MLVTGLEGQADRIQRLGYFLECAPMDDRTPRPCWRCKCGYWLPRHPKRLENGPKCPYCGLDDTGHRKPIEMVASFRVAPRKEDIE